MKPRQSQTDMDHSQPETTARPAMPVNTSQPGHGQMQPVPSNSRHPSPVRRPPGCRVCGRIGCHSDRHNNTTTDPQNFVPTGSYGDLHQSSAPYGQPLNYLR